MSKTMVKLENVIKSYSGESEAAVKGINLDIKEGEFFTMLGPSGCGKTTTLRMIAGFEQPNSGSILIDNIDVSSKAPYDRNVNTVFQNYALFPHLNIFDNVAFGLNVKKLNKTEVNKRVQEMLRIVRMEDYQNKMPDQLSGGQKQRIAIARAIINNPKVLLLDEPLAALDLKLRKQMQMELKHLQKELGITFIFVTHDQEEAVTMSDRICVMSNGHIEQIGSPEEIYEQPKSRFVADFIGETNIFEGKVVEILNNEVLVKLENNETITISNADANVNEPIVFSIRPERIKLTYGSGINCIPVTLKERTYSCSVIKTIVSLSNGRELSVTEPIGEKFDFAEGRQAYITLNSENMVVLKS